MKSIKVCEYSRSRSFHYDLILQDQASGELSQDQWSSGLILLSHIPNIPCECPYECKFASVGRNLVVFESICRHFVKISSRCENKEHAPKIGIVGDFDFL